MNFEERSRNFLVERCGQSGRSKEICFNAAIERCDSWPMKQPNCPSSSLSRPISFRGFVS